MLLRRLPFTLAVVTVVLWIVGLAVGGLSDNLSDQASDQQVLDWVQGNKTPILLGFWIFVLGSLAFIWFLTELRARMPGGGTMATLFYSAGVGAAVLSMLITADSATAIDSRKDITPAAAGALHHVGDVAFMAAELTFMLALIAFAIYALQTAAFPRWWAYVSLLVAVVLLIGPIGWAALIFGTPIWTLVTGWFVSRRGEVGAAVPQAV
jgi:hypothetical protein